MCHVYSTVYEYCMNETRVCFVVYFVHHLISAVDNLFIMAWPHNMIVTTLASR